MDNNNYTNNACAQSPIEEAIFPIAAINRLFGVIENYINLNFERKDLQYRDK